MNTLLEALKVRRWNISLSNFDSAPLPNALAIQYAALPTSFIQWLGVFDLCVNEAQTSWFLSRQDYFGSAEAEFRWNEIQFLSLEACETQDERKKVTTFWKEHFPIALAVHSSYDYLAISLAASNFGAVVHGSAPEWESPSTISSSFNEFLVQFESAARSKSAGWPYVLFL